MFARLYVPDVLLDGVFGHAQADLPNECCGLLAGRAGGDGARAEARFPVANAAASPTAYATDPRALLRAFRAMRERGLELLAIYHSHPASPPVPSARDLAENTYGETVAHLIVSLAGPRPVARAWRLAPGGARAVELVVTARAP